MYSFLCGTHVSCMCDMNSPITTWQLLSTTRVGPTVDPPAMGPTVFADVARNQRSEEFCACRGNIDFSSYFGRFGIQIRIAPLQNPLEISVGRRSPPSSGEGEVNRRRRRHCPIQVPCLPSSF